MGFVSELPCDCPGFRVKYKMPKGFKAPKMCLTTANASRKIEAVPFSYDEKTRELSVRVPGFGVWRNILALNELEPLVSVEFADGVKRDAYNLADFRPGDEVVVKVKVFNPSSKSLAGGEIQARLPDGWFYDHETVKVETIPAFGVSQEYSFLIKAPAVNCARRLKALNFVFNHPSLEFGSGPAVEEVWFQKEPQNSPAQEFGVK